MTGELTDAEAQGLQSAMVREDPLAWWETCVAIEDKWKNLIVAKQANVLQQRLARVVTYCKERDIYCPIVVLKPRSKGISTMSVGIGQWLQKLQARNMLIVGGLDYQAETLWKIYRRYAQTDTFNWGVTGSVMDQEATWTNGSQTRRQVAGGRAPGRSDVYQVVVNTEVAWWGEDGNVRNPDEVRTAVLASVPKNGFSLVIDESTSAGGSGAFFRLWENGIDAEAFLAGARKHGACIRIFAGVFEFEDSFIAPESPQEEAAILAGRGARNELEAKEEADLRTRYGLNAGQIKFWRFLLGECGNDRDKRFREFPVVPEDAFRAAQPCRFNRTMLTEMRDEARGVEPNLEWVMLEDAHKTGAYTPRRVVEKVEANAVIYERPLEGLAYWISVDNASGRAVGDDPSDTDCHAVEVWRRGYHCARRRRWMPDTIVATINPWNEYGKLGRREDIDILADWVYRLHRYYGNCMVVPEANNDAGLIRDLRKKGVLVYEQERPATEVQNHKPSGKFGFWMQGGQYESVRRACIEDMARAVREKDTPGDGVFIPFLWIIDEMLHFIRDPDTGKAAAMGGWHDDWVMAGCIAKATRDCAMVYHVGEVMTPDPPEVTAIETRAKAYEEPSFRV